MQEGVRFLPLLSDQSIPNNLRFSVIPGQLNQAYQQTLKALIDIHRYRNHPIIVNTTFDNVYLSLLDKIAGDSCNWVCSGATFPEKYDSRCPGLC